MLKKGYLVLFLFVLVAESKIKALPTEIALWRYFQEQGYSDEEMFHAFTNFLRTCRQLERFVQNNRVSYRNLEPIEDCFSHDQETEEDEGSEFSSPRELRRQNAVSFEESDFYRSRLNDDIN